MNWSWLGVEGSYGVSLWATKYFSSSPTKLDSWFREKYWGNKYSSIPSRVPFVGDSNWVGQLSYATDQTPQEYGDPGIFSLDTGLRNLAGSSMGRHCMNRHGDTVNMSFVDGSVRGVSLEELWTLKWHRGYKSREVIIE